MIGVRMDDVFLDELRRRLAEAALCLYKAEHIIEETMDLVTLYAKGVWKYEQNRSTEGQSVRVQGCASRKE